MNRKEKQQARAERYEELARKAETQSTQAWEKSHEMVSHIPMGAAYSGRTPFGAGTPPTARPFVEQDGRECKTRRKGRLLPAKKRKRRRTTMRSTPGMMMPKNA